MIDHVESFRHVYSDKDGSVWRSRFVKAVNYVSSDVSQSRDGGV